MNQVPPAPELPQAARRKAAISFAVAVLAAIVSVLELNGWHIYIGLGLVLIAAVYGLTRWNRRYRE